MRHHKLIAATPGSFTLDVDSISCDEIDAAIALPQLDIFMEIMAELQKPDLKNRVLKVKDGAEFSELVQSKVIGNHLSVKIAQAPLAQKELYEKVAAQICRWATSEQLSGSQEGETPIQVISISLVANLCKEFNLEKLEKILGPKMEAVSGLPPLDVDALFIASGVKHAAASVVGLGFCGLSMTSAWARFKEFKSNHPVAAGINLGIIGGELLQGAALGANFFTSKSAERFHHIFGATGLTVVGACSILEFFSLLKETMELSPSQEDGDLDVIRHLKRAEYMRKMLVSSFLGASQIIGGVGGYAEAEMTDPEIEEYPKLLITAAVGIGVNIVLGVIFNGSRFLADRERLPELPKEVTSVARRLLLAMARARSRGESPITQEDQDLLNCFLGRPTAVAPQPLFEQDQQAGQQFGVPIVMERPVSTVKPKGWQWPRWMMEKLWGISTTIGNAKLTRMPSKIVCCIPSPCCAKLSTQPPLDKEELDETLSVPVVTQQPGHQEVMPDVEDDDLPKTDGGVGPFDRVVLGYLGTLIKAVHLREKQQQQAPPSGCVSRAFRAFERCFEHPLGDEDFEMLAFAERVLPELLLPQALDEVKESKKER